MINFNDLKQPRIKKTLEFQGEKINILNPTKEIKEEIMKIAGQYSKIENNTVKIDSKYEDNPQFAQNLFKSLVEGIEFSDNIEEFKEVIDNPSPIVIEIQEEINMIVRTIGIERAKAISNEVKATKDLIVVNDIMEEMDEFSKKNKDFQIPEIVIENKKDITPKPKAKRKPTKKKTKKEEKVVDIKTVKKENKESKADNKEIKIEETTEDKENGLQ
ncbi:TPA: hypothetical protein ACXDAY_002080 [Clostridium botulinum]|uniref:hypothetical protein n=1 Tax=Clostridium botulinum TaxID=1491 RepID=UPI000466A6D9|nr:hypothetical protein [Clostridium botulinum]APR02572.1 hypothetical protein RSJ2_4109 [Clostridium botulinum]MBN3351946.1 hypothetical protein [Clostridium botulinum]MBN3359337.1 hypothetical protein [Clostridium botulinum]MBN3367166.1 hypothetical protein [Clostridium botulinum]MBN3371799.1 hypothetical protein [Clostridium botulinum]